MDDEAVVCMYVSRFVFCMVSRPNATSGISPTPSISRTRSVELCLWSGRERYVHKMCDGGLASAAGSRGAH